MKGLASASCVSSITAFGVASCCVLPIAMMLLGLGGSWIAVFGKLAAASYYVLVLASLITLVAWYLSFRRTSTRKLTWWLSMSTILVAVAWVVVLNEARINEFMIGLM